MNEEQQHRLALPQGTRIREFEFRRVLGHGGFGMTYLGWNVALDIPVAIKEYLPSDLATREQDLSVVPQAPRTAADFQWGLERFLDEARILARLQHPNIVRVHHFFEAHSTAYIAMDYVEGEDLSALLTRKETLSEDELKGILYPLLSALEVVHQADFLHRDIKPSNIILRTEDGSPVLLDFGAARQAMGAKSRSVTSIVTPGYAPIEQYSSRGHQGAWTDIYALGGVCYRALTGQVPDDATDRMRDDPLIPVSQRCAGRVSGAFLSAIDAALAVDEGNRPQSVGAWQAAMAADAQEGLGRETGNVSSKKKEKEKGKPKARSKRFAVILGVVALLIMGGIVIKEQAELEKQRQEQQAALEKERREQAELEKQRQEQAALEKERRKQAEQEQQAALEKKQQEQQAALEKERQEQAELEKQQEQQAALEKQRREQAALEKQQEQAALEKERREQAAQEQQQQEQAELEKQRQEQTFVTEVGRMPDPKGLNKGETDLHIVARLNLPVLTISLLNQGADIHAKDKDGWTPLHSAAKENASATAEVLLNQGADIHAKDKFGWTPLHLAATKENASATAEVLLNQGADIHAKDKFGWTPLHSAASNNSYETAKLLLNKGANVNAKDNNGWTPLYWAARKNASETAEILRRYGGQE